MLKIVKTRGSYRNILRSQLDLRLHSSLGCDPSQVQNGTSRNVFFGLLWNLIFGNTLRYWWSCTICRLFATKSCVETLLLGTGVWEPSKGLPAEPRGWSHNPISRSNTWPLLQKIKNTIEELIGKQTNNKHEEERSGYLCTTSHTVGPHSVGLVQTTQTLKSQLCYNFLLGSIWINAGTGSRSRQLFDFLSLLPLPPDTTAVSTVSAVSQVSQWFEESWRPMSIESTEHGRVDNLTRRLNWNIRVHWSSWNSSNVDP